MERRTAIKILLGAGGAVVAGGLQSRTATRASMPVLFLAHGPVQFG